MQNAAIVALGVLERGGMGVYRFEDLRVWQAAKLQSDRVGELLQRPEFRADRELSDQLNGASLSVMLNISEGFLRRQDKAMRQFFRYAAASNGELRGCLYAAEGRNYLARAEATELIEASNAIGRMITRFQATLGDGRGNKREQ